jgi:hypothetical protein
MKRFTLKHVTSSDPDFSKVVDAENRVFYRAFKNSPQVMEQEYGPYRESSEFLAVFDNTNGRVAGFIRFIRHSDIGFKSLNDLEKEPWGGRTTEQILLDTGLHLEKQHVLDVATLGVEVGYRAKDNRTRGAFVSTALYHGLVKYSIEHDISHWVAVLDDKVLAVVQGQGAKFRPYAGVKSASYLDSPSSTPVWTHLPTSLSALDPIRYHLFTKGFGLKTFVEIPKQFKRK